MLNQKVGILYCWARPFRILHPTPRELGVFQHCWWEQVLFPALCRPEKYSTMRLVPFPLILLYSSLPNSHSFLTCICWSIFSWILKAICWRILGLFSVQLPSLWTATFISPDFPLCLLNSEVPRVLPGFPFPGLWPQYPLMVVIWGSHRLTSLFYRFFSVSWESLFFIVQCPVSWKSLLQTFYLLIWVSWGRRVVSGERADLVLFLPLGWKQKSPSLYLC